MLRLGAETKDPFYSSAVVVAPIENDEFAGGRKVRQISLNIPLRFLAVGWRRKCDDPKDTRTATFGDRPDRAPLSCSIAAFENNNDFLTRRLDPFLDARQLSLQQLQFFFIVLASKFHA